MVVHHLLNFAWIIVYILNTDKKSATALEESSHCVFNDNYCDCGHDELLSSAYSYHSSGRLFQCDDNQYFNQSLFLSRVGDGVCDCCDGSDETLSNNLISCPNICAEIGLLLQLEVAARKEMKENGASERNAIIHNEEVKRRKMKMGYQKAKKAIAENRKVIKEYQLQLIGEEELESREFDRMSLLVESSFRQSLLRLSVEKIRRLLAVITLLIGDEGVESILLECDDMYEFDGPEPNDLSAFALVTASTCRAHIIEADKEASIQNTFSTTEIPTATIDSMIIALSLNRLS